MTTQRRVMAAMVLGAALAAVWIALRPAANRAQAAAAAPTARIRWEYMSVIIDVNCRAVSTGECRYAPEATESYMLQTPQATREFKTLAELAKQVGVEPKQEGMATVLNALGAEGWELVSVDSHTLAMPLFQPMGACYWPTATRQRWTLKRPL